MWKTYYQAAGDNKHSAYVCLNAYLVVKNESCAKTVSFSLLPENVQYIKKHKKDSLREFIRDIER